MSAVPTTHYTWSLSTVEAAGAEPMALHLSIQALIQNQVDQILKETHTRRWSEWQHEDLRGQTPSTMELRRSLKKVLTKKFPGLLAGPHARALQQEDWLPCYVLSASVPISRLRETSHGTDLRVLNILWQHIHSKALSITLYNNHLDPSATMSNFLSENLSTNRRSQWAVGTHGRGFLHACHYVLGSYRQATGGNPYQLGIALRVGDTTGTFMYQSSDAGKSEVLVLRRQDLTPLSLKAVSRDKGFSYPFDHLLPQGTSLPLSHKTRIFRIYNQRFVQGLSECAASVRTATEPDHERSFVKADEVVITIYGLDGSLSPEYLFSGVYGVFPPPPTSTWTVPAQGRNTADIIFFLPPSNSTFPENSTTSHVWERPGRFYYRDYLVSAGPSSQRLCVNYGGDLFLTTSGISVQTNNDLYTTYRRTLSKAIDTAIRTIPELAVELAYDILTEPEDLPDAFGRVLSPSQDIRNDDGAKQAYRTAFSKAWCRLDPTLATRDMYLYPYVAGAETMARDVKLIEQLGVHPVPVHAHVKALLERVGASPPIKDFADQILRSAPGVVSVPQGIQVLKECLVTLFPNLRGSVLSVRQYAYSFPRAVWDEEAQVFVVGSAACQCDSAVREDASGSSESHAASGLPCMCWFAPTLQEAVFDWHTKTFGRRNPGAEPDLALEKRLFHVLYQNCKFPPCIQNDPQEITREADDGSEDLEYADLQHPDSDPQGSDPDPESEDAAATSPFGPAQRDAQVSPIVPVSEISEPNASPSIPRRLARLAMSVTARAVAGSSRTSEETLVEPPPSVASWWQEGISDLLKILTAMDRNAESSGIEVQHHYEREVSSLREQLAQSRQELETVKEESATLYRETSGELLKSVVALRDKEDAFQVMEEKLRDRETALYEQNQEIMLRDGRLRDLEQQVRDMEEEMQKSRRVKERFGQLTRVIQALDRDESVDLDFSDPVFDEESGPSQKRARVE
ncbi:hypothetical protein L227DRAFT_653035 [Lentinus tigrinus ALCF2SS1-6]|uniref:Uncharacterized protein n=1 Tax=Lentinus tigrinus ALCF2SS1-6 TaxID=1328759 RepID=A0A5C2SBV0_9APHY|nr:hypothetical protein L227DRAFT_653035 [Lentinus tigrinus ALCF2SS1-6]